MPNTATEIQAQNDKGDAARREMLRLGYDINGPHINGTMSYGDAVKAENKVQIRNRAFLAVENYTETNGNKSENDSLKTD